MSKGRLPSFRGPRDLSLGAKADGSRKPVVLPKSSWSDADKKKKFTPNLNIQRKDAKASTTDSSSKPAPTGWKKGQGKNDSAPRTNKFAKPELIQTTGTVFADGVGSSSDLKKKGWGSSGASGGSSDSKAALERPKLDLNAKFDKSAEEKMLKELLRDDFIDDLKTGHLVPVQLPMVDTGKVFKEEQNGHIKKETLDSDEIMKTGKTKKNRIIDSSDEEDDDDKIKDAAAAVNGNSADSDREITLSDLINEKHSELLFFQMPDHFPGQGSHKVEDLQEGQNVTLDHLSEGYLGKLQLRKSGKVQLWINNVLFDVDIGTQVGFLQELYSVEGSAGQENGSTVKGNMTNLGRVRNRVVVTQAWKDLFQITNVEDSSSDSDEN